MISTSFSEDITPQTKETSNADVLNAAKAEFLANISHDCKTPLTGIIGMSEVLLKRLKDLENVKCLQHILNSSQELLKFFDSCLELIKLEKMDSELIVSHFSLKSMINDIAALYESAIALKPVHLSIHCDENIPDLLLGCHSYLYRIFLNLLGNAVKFTDAGNITINMSLGTKSTPKEAIIKVSISDTGPGIPKNKQHVIFQRLSRLQPSYHGNTEGTGIGLYVVKKLLDRMGGEIHLESDEKKGSIFMVVIPLKIPLLQENEYQQAQTLLKTEPPPLLPDPLTPPSKLHSSPEAPLKRTPNTPEASTLRVLLIEDNQISQQVVCMMLTPLGYQLDIADTGEKALAYFEPGKYDLIYLDIGLPDINGYTLAKIFRRLEQTTKHQVPLIALTAHAAVDVRRYCEGSGINGVLSKPLSSEQNKQIIERFVKGSSIDIEGFHSLEKLSANSQTESKSGIIDLEQGAEIIAQDEFAAKRMLHNLYQSLPKNLKEMNEAYRSGDAYSLKQAVHRFHSSLCYTGTPRLREAVQTMQSSQNGSLANLMGFYKNVLDEIRAFEKAYKKMFL